MKKKVAIMQPYLFPYIGYFQLIHAADIFIFHDDVQYIKGGWINRNRVLLNKEDYLYTFSLRSDSSKKNINERYFTPDFSEQCDKFLRVLQTAYSNAPNYERTRQMVSGVFEVMNQSNTDENIATKISRSVQYIANYLDLNTEFFISSNLNKNNDTNGEERVIEIAEKVNADTYINPSGGEKLYDSISFNKRGIKLRFLNPEKKTYMQFSENFIPWLSIIDVCMFCDRQEVIEQLRAYSLSQ